MDGDLVVAVGAILTDDDRVCTFGKGRSSHDARSLARAHHALANSARLDRLGDGQGRDRCRERFRGGGITARLGR